MTVALADIEAAARRLRGKAVLTPLIESPALNEQVGGRVLVKAESLQRAGAFKFRGAYNRLSRLESRQRRRGVVAYSSGNHAQGVALAARLLGVPALIVMPSDAPAVKIEGTRRLGAEVVLYDRARDNRESIAEALAQGREAVVVPAYDDADIIAGQGTVGLEIARQLRAITTRADFVIGPVGGGGLMAGVSTAIKALSPATGVWGVEPVGFEDTRLSLAAGRRVRAPPHTRSLCDALEAPMPGELTFPVLQRNLEGVVAVSDDAVEAAMRCAFFVLKLVGEPGGVVALASVLTSRIDLAGRTAVVIVSGANVDPALFARVLQARP
jgi:threonine dehydratase